MAGEGVEHKSSYAFGGFGGRKGSSELLINLYTRTAAPAHPGVRMWQNFWWGTTFTDTPRTASPADTVGGSSGGGAIIGGSIVR